MILDPTVRPSQFLIEIMKAAAAEGGRLFQYRNKSSSMKEAYSQALGLRKVARDLGVLFIVNDRCDLALAVDADGVHLGQEDLPCAEARRLLGTGKLIGISTHNADQVRLAATLDPDYLGFGPIFTPRSKQDHDPTVGLDGLRAVRPLTTLPVFAIGGISREAVAAVMQAGANGVAVISAVLHASDVREAVRGLMAQMPK